jgi:glycerol-3-phosphate acyltransferase PlsY
MQNLYLYLATYLIAGIPFGYLLAKQFGGVNIKEEGSGNIGATNVLRVLKDRDPSLAKKLGALTLFLDMIKGVVMVLIAKMLGADAYVLWTVAVLAVLGHCFSAFLWFEGGKGVATGVGVIAVLAWPLALIALVVWIGVAKGLKISSLSAIIAILVMMGSAYFVYPDGLPGIATLSPLWIIAMVILYKHTPNIVRLFQGEEGKVA